MYLIVSPNQLGYFKPETTARRLKLFLQEESDEKRFLAYLDFIQICHKLFVKVAPLKTALYQKEVDKIYRQPKWTHYMAFYLYKLRVFFKKSAWVYLLKKYRYYQAQFLLVLLRYCQRSEEYLNGHLCSYLVWKQNILLCDSS